MKIKNSEVESTPVAYLILTKAGKQYEWFKQYWTNSRGAYGHQICHHFNYGDYDTNYSEGKTSGCGYCKESNSLETFATAINGHYISLGGSLNYFLGGTKYHKGVNYYEMPLTAFKRLVRRGGNF